MTYLHFFIELVNAILHVYIGYIFYSSFGTPKDNKVLKTLIPVICIILLTISLLLFKGTVILYIPMIVVTYILTFTFDSKFSHKILCTVLYLVIPGLVELFVGFLLSVLFHIEIKVITDYSPFHISGILISKLITLFIVLFIRTRKKHTLLAQYKKKYFSILLFPASTLAVAFLQCKIFIDYPEQNNLTKYSALISYAILILANIIVFDFIDSLYNNTLSEAKISAANEIINNQTYQYQELINHNKEVLRIKHDHKNFCIGLKAEIEDGNIENIIRILEKECNISQTDIPNNGNVILTIINIKQQESAKHNINFEFNDYDVLSRINIDPTDLAIILGNALDNAIEACTKVFNISKKCIHIFLSIKSEKIYVRITNPVSKQVDINNLTTSKEKDPEKHGFGIISMQQIAHKYNGEVLFSCDNCEFSTIFILSNKSLV